MARPSDCRQKRKPSNIMIMVRKETSSAGQGVIDFVHEARGDSFPFRQFFELLPGATEHSTGLLVTSLPRGGLQIAQPQRVPESLVRHYGRGLDGHDRLSWTAIV